MYRVALLVALCAACQSHAPVPEDSPPRFAVLLPEGIVVHHGQQRVPVPATDDVETFCWAIDGTSMVGTTRDALVAIEPDGQRRTISAGWLAIRFPSVSPDGDEIAVGARRETGEPWGVWLIPTDGRGKARRLADGHGPSWSADGFSIYYERYTPNQQLAVLDLSTRKSTPFLNDGRPAYTIVCSRSGRKILFTRGRALTLYEPGRSSLRELTDQRTYNRFPSVSPGERYVLFFREDPTGQTHPERAIILLDLRTGKEQVIDTSAELAVFAP